MYIIQRSFNGAEAEQNISQLSVQIPVIHSIVFLWVYAACVSLNSWCTNCADFTCNLTNNGCNCACMSVFILASDWSHHNLLISLLSPLSLCPLACVLMKEVKKIMGARANIFLKLFHHVEMCLFNLEHHCEFAFVLSYKKGFFFFHP